MNLQALIVFSLLVPGGAAFAASSHAASLATDVGLVLVHSRNLDELYLRPGADLAAYRRVMIDPVPVAFHDNWLQYKNSPGEVMRPVSEDGVRRIAEDTATSVAASIADAFRARGYEIAAAPEPGVLRLSPSVTGLYVNAPDRLSPWRTKTFTRDVGEAVLLLEARDSVSGTPLGRVVHRGTAQQMGGLARATDASNRFWFDALFRRWAENCVVEFAGGIK